MKKSLELWYEFASTYSYPAAMRCEALAVAQGLAITWRPFLLGPIFAGLGWSSSPFNLQPAKGAYMWRDMERTCAALGLGFQKPEPFPQNGLKAARIAMALPDDGSRAAFSRSVYDLQFTKGRDISDENVLSDGLADLGVTPSDLLSKASSPEVKASLRAQTEAAQAMGIFGAPTWRTPDGEIFWGNDRLEDALSWVLTHLG